MSEPTTNRQTALISLATGADVLAVIELVREVLAEFHLTFGEGNPTDAQLTGLPSAYQAHGGRFGVVTLDHSLVGTCGACPVGPRSYELRKMYLAREARGLGLGRRLLELAIAFAREQGMTELVLNTAEQMMRARAVYEANGFVRDDRQSRGSRCSRGYRLDLIPLGGLTSDDIF